jgi:RNA polymerase sigma-70 factor (ECF subfamily)
VKKDEQLVKEAQEGSDAAFSELVQRYRDKLLRFLLTRSQSHADAEDAIQDTFVNAYRYLDSFNPRWRFSTWIYRIAIRNAAQSAQPNSDENVEIADHDDPLSLCIDHGERENMWLTAKRTLSSDAFNAMWLHYVEDLPVKEVSRALSKSTSWTKVTMLRSRRRLTRELTAPGSDGSRSSSYG